MKWLKGLLSAFISGIACGVTVMVVAPTTFNLEAGWKKLVTVCVLNGIVGAANYIKKSPL